MGMSCFRVLMSMIWLCGLVGMALPTATAQGQPAPRPEDVSTLDGIIRAYYEVVSRPAGVAADQARDKSLHHPEASVIITGKDAGGRPFIRRMNLAQFHEAAGGPGEKGFFEWEIHREVQRFGNIAHVWSTYASSETPQGAITSRGINSIQLYHDGQRWWITSWIYDSEQRNQPIPERYLSKD